MPDELWFRESPSVIDIRSSAECCLFGYILLSDERKILKGTNINSD